MQAAGENIDWTKIVAQAERHGLGPLLYTQLKAADVTPPTPIKRELQGLYLRHRQANQIRTRILAEILTTCEAANIQVLVLKGAALAHLIYPQPGLRPMRDIDLLVKKSQAYQAQALLAKLGFEAPLARADHLPDKHLKPATRYCAGLLVSVEIHHDLFNAYSPVSSMTIEDLTGPPLEFSLDNRSAYTLGYEDMLWHLCQHVVYHTNVTESIRFIWIADIVGFAERFVANIEWRRVQKQYPLILDLLSLFHFATPLSERLRQQASIPTGSARLDVGQDFQGWPRLSLADQRRKGVWRIFSDSFIPSEWWLRLNYRIGGTRPIFWTRWVRHPFHILGCALQVLKDRI